jgi:predicted CoA-binding protein
MSDSRAIRRFLACGRLALVGVSRDRKDFSRALLRELSDRGYDVVAVNPCAPEIDGRLCYPSVREIDPPVEAALLMTAPAQSAGAVQDCLDAGVRRIWFHRGFGPGSLSPEALELCREAGADVVAGECPYMHLPHSGVPHRVHGFFRHLGARRGRRRVGAHP